MCAQPDEARNDFGLYIFHCSYLRLIVVCLVNYALIFRVEAPVTTIKTRPHPPPVGSAISVDIEVLRREATASGDKFLAYLLGMAELHAREQEEKLTGDVTSFCVR